MAPDKENTISQGCDIECRWNTVIAIPSDRIGFTAEDLGGRIGMTWWLSMRGLIKGAMKIVQVLGCTTGCWVHQRKGEYIINQFAWTCLI